MNPITPADANGIYALMAFLVDPKACAKRMEELRTVEAQIADGLQSSEKKSVEAEAALAKANKLVQDAQRQLTDLAAQQEQTRSKDGALAEKEKQLTKIAAGLSAREKELANREAALNKRDARVAEREQTIEGHIAAANQAKAAYDAKMAKLQSALN